ncbi:MAG: TIM barrel protein, partial [Pyrinomonadaceae bacterium]|nr:TIM barrel protein [Sphingobacteriaceae bacterium]
MVTRRKFLQHAGIATGAILLNPFDTMAGKANHKIGLQLYSLNKEIRNDTIKAVLKKVSAAGYKAVETYGYSKSGKFWGLSPADFKQVLIDNNLITTSGHYGLDDYLRPNGSDEVIKSYIEAASLSGQTYITVPFMSDNIRETTDAYKAIAAKLNKAGEMCKASNLKIAYHNHDFEFFP